ncbi:hypothetical protein FAZ95_03840 [Trinickia violacea]|uniref:Alpha/beta hydrolase n=1 Tax=Trinickia violacea TaxID=2571746 RepID=A0A4P8IJK9_9BURK|nr:hypothetical protein [Trinickia violacea]QCP48396.1 hypothetical protein FAZ95_03840 [Trinickia violacea]
MIRKLFLVILFALPIGVCAENLGVETGSHASGLRSDFIVPTAASAEFPFSGTEITMPDGNRLRYYSSDTSMREKPLVIFIPGSECNGAFPAFPDGQRSMGSEGFALKFKGKVRLVVVESPGIEDRFARETASGCSLEFKKMANMQARLDALRTIIDDLRHRGWINSHPFMIVASSEGVSIASRFAMSTKEVSHLLLISGFGTGQTLATLHAALTGWGNWNFLAEVEPNDPLDRLQSTLTGWEQVRRSQVKESNVTIAGHGEAYWRTIGMASPAENVLESKTQLYLVQGGLDQSASAVDYEAGIAYLVAHDRPFVTEYIPCGDHFLVCPKDNGEPNNLQKVIERGMEWFLTGRVQSAFAASFNPSATLQ